MTNFDEHLWSHLVTEHGADRISARRPGAAAASRRPVILPGIAGLTAAGVAVGVLALTATDATSPAFAVTRHHDGSVTVRVNRESGIAGANRRLATMGIRAQVSAARQGRSLPASWTCTVIPGSTVNLQAMRADAARDAAAGDESAAQALRTGANAIADGSAPDVVYSCTSSGDTGSGSGGQ